MNVCLFSLDHLQNVVFFSAPGSPSRLMVLLCRDISILLFHGSSEFLLSIWNLGTYLKGMRFRCGRFKCLGASGSVRILMKG